MSALPHRPAAWASRTRCPVDVSAIRPALRRAASRGLHTSAAYLRCASDAAAAALIVPVALAGGALVGWLAAQPRLALELRRFLGIDG